MIANRCFPPREVVEADVEHYRTMPLHEVMADLRQAGIDPQLTVDAVLEMVQRRLRESVHAEAVGMEEAPERI